MPYRYELYPALTAEGGFTIVSSVSSGSTVGGVSYVVENPNAFEGILYLGIASVTGSACGIKPQLFQSYNGSSWYLNTAWGSPKYTTSAAFKYGAIKLPITSLSKYLQLRYVVSGERKVPVATSPKPNIKIKSYFEMKSYY
jgi:hypothetical protein